MKQDDLKSVCHELCEVLNEHDLTNQEACEVVLNFFGLVVTYGRGAEPGLLVNDGRHIGQPDRQNNITPVSAEGLLHVVVSCTEGTEVVEPDHVRRPLPGVQVPE